MNHFSNTCCCPLCLTDVFIALEHCNVSIWIVKQGFGIYEHALLLKPSVINVEISKACNILARS